MPMSLASARSEAASTSRSGTDDGTSLINLSSIEVGRRGDGYVTGNRKADLARASSAAIAAGYATARRHVLATTAVPPQRWHLSRASELVAMTQPSAGRIRRDATTQP